MVRSQGTDQRVPLLASVVLLLDDEAEQVGVQVLQLNHALDSLVQSRMNFLRIRTGPDGSLQAAIAGNERQEMVPSAVKMRLDVNMAAYQVVEEMPGYFSAPTGDPGATQAISPTLAPTPVSGLKYESFQPFEVALRNALQQSMRSAGVEPLAERGYALVPNEVAIYIVGRADAHALAATAKLTQVISKSISTQIDARRFALLIAAPPSDAPVQSIPLAGGTAAGWQGQAMAQPWHELLSWQQGEPPLLYAFMYESWDEAGRFHKRPELHYAIAESLFALFTTGILEHPQFREALDFSAAAFDSADGLSRLGSIGTSIITEPTQSMIDYLANRIAADVLIRNGLMGNTSGLPGQTTTTHRTLVAEAHDEAEKWLKTALRGRLLPQSYPLPRALPPHELEDGKLSQWFSLALSTASPDPAPLLWRWVSQNRLYLNDERFWNVAAQNEFETFQDARLWVDNLAIAMKARSDEIKKDLINTINWRMLGAQGTERAKAFARELTDLLIKEEILLEEAFQAQRADVERHQRVYETYLRQTHQHQGVPQRANPPARPDIPQLPRNMEAVAHEVIDQSFARTPLPGTLVVVGILMAMVGAFMAPVVGHLSIIPKNISSLLDGQYGSAFGAAALVIIFALALIGPIVNITTLRQRQQRYASERALLWLTYAKEFERVQMEAVVHEILQEAQQSNTLIENQVRVLEATVRQLNQEAQLLRDQVATAALSRDIFISRGLIWEGANPDELYLQIRERLEEPQLIEEFLRYVDAHASDVIVMMGNNAIGQFAVDFLRAKLRATPNESPFTMWDAATAAQALDRANQAARIPLQPQLAGRALGHVQALSINPAIAWMSRVAQDRGYIIIPTATQQTIVVVRVVSRAHHSLVR